MRKIYLLFTAFVLCSIAGFSQNYNVTTSPQCNTTAAGNEIVNFTGATPNANGNGTITMYFKGDFDGKLAGNEYLDLYGETGPIMANTTQSTTGISNTQCATLYDSIVVPVTMADLNNWASDGTITFTADGASGVSVTCTAPGTAFCVYMRLQYPRASGLNDIGVASVDTPGLFCAGPQNIWVKVQNYGINQVNNCTVNWTFNGVAQTPINVNQLIDTANGLNPNNIQVMLGSKTIIDKDTLVAWTSNPNGGIDTININDTIKRVLAPSLAGALTLNSAQATGGTNYQTFTDFANDLNSNGVCGPVVLNVASGSGPYNEQVTIQQIAGASATNTIIINGNGATLTDSSTNTNKRAVVLLDGADRVTINNLNLVARGIGTGAFGYGVQLTNTADFNTINNCTITVDTVTASTNYTGIVVNGSVSATATTAGSNCDGNTFSGNTINGGYYGITLTGNSAAPFISNNTITNNTIKNFYNYGIYLLGNDTALVEGNDISRPTRTNSTTFAGVIFTGINRNVRFSKNRIHNAFDAMTSNTSTSYVIYSTSSDATLGNENIISNNLIYNISSSGVIYGIYTTSSDYYKYYHNTISLDDLSTTTTSATRGISQTTTASGLQFFNNIISIKRGGTGINHGIYMATAATTWTANNNDYYIAGTGTNHVGYSGSNQTTLANWQTTTSQDAASYDLPAIFVDPNMGDYTPGNNLIDNVGTFVGISTDILNATRNATTPDIGAYEFSVPVCTTPPTPGTAVISPLTLCTGGTVTFSLTGNSSGSGQTYQWEAASSINGPYTAISSPPSSITNYTTTVTSSMYYRAAVTCVSATTTTSYSDTVLVTVPTPFPSGTYTINGTQPTGGTNFQTFADASNAITCAIAGPIVFNVSPGTYTNDHFWLDSTANTSTTNTITVNGNGATILFYSSNAVERAAIRFNGTDHVSINNLNIAATGSTTTEYGGGIHLTNNADSNTISNCTITVDTVVASTNYVPIAISGSLSALTLNSRCDGNTFTGNTLNGGYYGIVMYGNSAVPLISNNTVTNNTIKNFYNYGIFIYGNDGSLVENNDIARPTRTNSTTFAGVIFSGLNRNIRFSKNRIHNAFDAMTSNTSTSYVIYSSSSDATLGNENIISNNLVYNINSSGVVYGIYNTGSDYYRYYHNTVSLDDVSTTTASATRGISQTTLASGLQFFNNIISIKRGGAGINHGIYMATATTTWTANNNNYHVAGAGTNHVGYSGSNQTTLANWQTTTSQDANSVAVDPIFVNPATGNYKPTSPALDNLGTPLTAVPNDILNVVRSTSTPDIGAYEFVPPTCPAPSALTATVTDTTALLGWTVNSAATQWQIEYGITGFTQGTGTVIATSFNPYNLTGLARGTSYQYYVRSICAIGDSSTWSGPTQFATPPTNDSCVNAINISNGQVFNGTTAGATEDMLPCDPTTVSPFGNDVWYLFTTGSVGGSVTVSVNTTVTGTDVVLSVFDGSCNTLNILTATTGSAGSSSLSCIDGTNAANNEFGTYTVLASTTYYVRVYGFTGIQGSFPIQATGAPLAIKLRDITATNVATRNRIDWNTASEDKGDYFILERSANGRDFTALSDEIKAEGKASIYTYWDQTPINGVNHYRLRMMDAAGRSTLSKVVTATVKGKANFSIEAHPNPVSEKLQVITYGAQGNNPAIIVTDVTGKLIRTIKVTGTVTEINMSGMANGLYMIKYIDAIHTQTIKVNKQ